MRKLILMTIILFVFSSVAWGEPVTKILSDDTPFHPQGWPEGTIQFKAGTQIILNEDGEVITGTPIGDGYLVTAGSAMNQFGISASDLGLIRFKGNPYSITFNEKGEVISGTLSYPKLVRLLNRKDSPVKFKGSTLIVFNPDGSIKQGTIDSDCFFRPVGWKNFLPIDNNAGFIKFKEGTEIIFGSDAKVLKGTIGVGLNISGKLYPENTTLMFSETANPTAVN